MYVSHSRSSVNVFLRMLRYTKYVFSPRIGTQRIRKITNAYSREGGENSKYMSFSCVCAAGLEVDAEACERRELGDARKAEEATRRAEEARKRDKEERDALKDKIVGRYADEVKVCVLGYLSDTR